MPAALRRGAALLALAATMLTSPASAGGERFVCVRGAAHVTGSCPRCHPGRATAPAPDPGVPPCCRWVGHAVPAAALPAALSSLQLTRVPALHATAIDGRPVLIAHLAALATIPPDDGPPGPPAAPSILRL